MTLRIQLSDRKLAMFNQSRSFIWLTVPGTWDTARNSGKTHLCPQRGSKVRVWWQGRGKEWSEHVA